jgi:hypothetical protein
MSVQKMQKPAKKAVQPPKTLLEFLGLLLRQMPKNLLKSIPWMILMSGFTWVFHTYLLVFINEGFDVTGASRWIKAALSGPWWPSGILFWTLMGGLASFAFGQLRQNGLGKTFNAIGSTPGWIVKSLKGFSMPRLALLLGSLVSGFLVMAIANSPLYAFQFGLLLVGEWLAQGKGLLGIVVPLGWSDAQRLFRRSRPPAPFSPNGMALVLAGLSTSAFCGLIFPFWFLACVLGWMMVGLVVLLVTRKGRPTPQATIILLGGLLAMGWLALRLNGVVLADDGGWGESCGRLDCWITSAGAATALGFGFPPALGSALGWLFGSTLAGVLGISTIYAPVIAGPAVSAVPQSSSVPDWVTDPEVIQGVKAWQNEIEDARKEAEKFQKQWDAVKGSYDVNDPNYQQNKDQYTKYIEYQNQRAAAAQAQIDQVLSDEAKYQEEVRAHNAYEEYRRTEGAWIDKQREKLETRDTAFDHEMDANVEKNKKEADQLDHLQKIRNAALDHGLGNAGGPGDAVKHADDLIQDLLDGKSVSEQDIEKIGRVIKDRVSGASKKEGEELAPSNMDIAANFITSMPKTIFTGINADGTTNYTLVGIRIGLAVGTSGASEWVYTPTNMTYNAKDAIDRGASDNDALHAAVNQAAFDIVTGKVIGGGISLVGKGLKYIMPGTAKTVGKFVGGTIDKISKAFKGEPVPQPIPTAHLDAVNRALKNALKSGDEKAIANLYRNGGMNDLAKLEQLGHISPEAAKQLNKVLTNSVNKAIDKGTENAIKVFEAQTGVKVERVYVGDSGSSAKGGPRSVRTDFDRTGVPEFNEQTVNSYAAKNGLTQAQAEAELKKQFCDTHFNEVDQSLKQSGMPGGASDVDYKTYNGIGSNAGNSDSYSYGFTTQRQTLGGKTKVYVPDESGGPAKTYETSGEAIVDADGLAKGRVEGGLPDAPNKVVPEELPGVISQQAKSAAGHGDVKSLAKAAGRAEKASSPLGIDNPDLDKLHDVTKQINQNPQQMNQILKDNHLTPEQYVQRVRDGINQAHKAAQTIKFPEVR